MKRRRVIRQPEHIRNLESRLETELTAARRLRAELQEFYPGDAPPKDRAEERPRPKRTRRSHD